MRSLPHRHAALALAALQALDLVYTEVSPKYGEEHFDHLGVPRWLRPFLPVIKTAAVAGLVGLRDRRPVALPLVSYYSAAATFHVLSDDSTKDVVPAVFCAALAAAITVSRPAPA